MPGGLDSAFHHRSDCKRNNGAAMTSPQLGEMLYWLGAGIAALIVIFAIVRSYRRRGTSNRLKQTIFILAMAFIPWLIGRACLRILAGI